MDVDCVRADALRFTSAVSWVGMSNAISQIEHNEPSIEETSIQRRRIRLVLALVAILVTAEFALWEVRGDDERPWWVHFLAPPISLAAGLRCLRTIGGLVGHERRAWIFFALGAFSYLIGELIWASYSAVYGDPLPSPYWFDLFYPLTPICLVTGLWYYQLSEARNTAKLVQVGNFGIIFSVILAVYLISYFDSLHVDLDLGIAVLARLYDVAYLAPPAFGLSVVYRSTSGSRRRVLILLCLSFGALAVMAANYDALLTVSGWQNLDWGIVMVGSFGCFLYWAAFEQDQKGSAESCEVFPQGFDEHPAQWESLIPSFVFTLAVAAAFAFRNLFTTEMAPYITVASMLFVISLGVRNWYGHQLEVESLAQVRQSEARLQRANRDLWEEMKTRTQMQEELRQSQKMEALGQLTGGVAHEFNNLLGIITTSSELSRMMLEAKEDVAENLKVIERAAARGGALTQRLLSMLRQQDLKPEHLDVASLLDGMKSMLQVTLGDNIRLEMEKPSKIWSCLADKAQLESAILNLAINARDAMTKTGVLSIRSMNVTLDETYAQQHPESHPGEYVTISMRDTGEGIAADALQKVFEPFYTTKRPGEGTGLGLSMVYGFVKQSGGHVAIESEEQSGTEVRLYFPSSDHLVGQAEVEPPESIPRGRGESLVVVEDEPDVRKFVTALLQRLGYQATAAADGVEALALLERLGGVDLLLSDVVLPAGLSGVELVKRTGERWPGVKLLLMSGYAARVLKHYGDLQGKVELLHKPFTQSELAQAVRRVLDEGKVLERS